MDISYFDTSYQKYLQLNSILLLFPHFYSETIQTQVLRTEIQNYQKGSRAQAKS